MSAETFNQIDEQLAAQGSQDAIVLVERGNGNITPARVLGRGEDTTRVFYTNLGSEVTDRRIPSKIVNSEALSDTHQEMLAEKLAGAALRGTEVGAVATNESFDPEIASLERAIKDAEDQKSRAQREGNGENSIYWGQVAGQYTLELHEKRK